MPRTVDRNPKTTFFLWHVSLPHAHRTLENTMLRTLAQLYGRLRHETRRSGGRPAGGLSLAPAGGAAGVPSSSGEYGAESQEVQLAAKRHADYLETAILRLHETLTLFRAV